MNQAPSPPSMNPRTMPFSSCSNPSYRSNVTPLAVSSSTACSTSSTARCRTVKDAGWWFSFGVDEHRGAAVEVEHQACVLAAEGVTRSPSVSA